MEGWITGKTCVEPCTRVSICRISQSMAQHGWSIIPCPCGFNRGELVLLPCSFGVCLREKNKKEKKRGVFAPGFFKVKHAVWQSSAVKKANT